MGDGRSQSWGRYPKVTQELRALHWRTDSFPALPQGKTILPRGQGRSYGDACLNDGEYLLSTSGLDRLIGFSPATGLLRCESGVTLEQILAFFVPQGWFLPVTPGTKYVTIGGAIANDVHGKNHHRAGNFGHHVRRFELLRSDGTRRICSPTENADWYQATIGGLGLTGLITWAEVQLKPVQGPFISQEVIRFKNIEEFFQISESSDADYEYTVSWIDCLAHGKSLGRGHFIRGNHSNRLANRLANRSASRLTRPEVAREKRKKNVPFDFPGWTLNSLSVKAFNTLYYNRQISKSKFSTVHYDPFFYPLDAIRSWNRIYGKRGFLQYQCVVPYQNGNAGSEAIREVLGRIAAAKTGSFLAVLKTFGNIPAVGMMSFPRPGVTLALDFPNSGEKLYRLFESLDQVVAQAGGALYPAKDARMSSAHFLQFYPRYSEFIRFIDPQISSSFWRRTGGAPQT
jgi:FAD/FMN-containing dehydrogenase